MHPIALSRSRIKTARQIQYSNRKHEIFSPLAPRVPHCSLMRDDGGNLRCHRERIVMMKREQTQRPSSKASRPSPESERMIRKRLVCTGVGMTLQYLAFCLQPSPTIVTCRSRPQAGRWLLAFTPSMVEFSKCVARSCQVPRTGIFAETSRHWFWVES